MFMKKCLQITTRAGAAAVIFGLASHLAFSQDPIKVAPEYYKVLQENEQERVLEIHLPPGQKAAMHAHPDYIIYNFSPCQVRFTAPDGKTTEAEFKAGEAAFRPGEIHAVENIGKAECHVLNIEL